MEGRSSGAQSLLQSLLQLLLLLLLSLVCCLGSSCTLADDIVHCPLTTSNIDRWFSGLDHRWKPVRALLSFDSAAAPEFAGDLPEFPNSNLVVLVNVTVDVCPPDLSPGSIASTNDSLCLDHRAVERVLGAILKMFPAVEFLQVSSDRPLPCRMPETLPESLSMLRTSGLRLAFERPLSSMPSGLTDLSFESAGVRSLDQLFFPDCCGRSVTNLALNRNEIESLDVRSDATQVSSFLRYVELKNNRLTRIGRGSLLTGLKELTSLHLCENRIRFIHCSAFDGLTKLMYLSLRGNLLVSVPVVNSVVGSQFGLKELILRSNTITSFDGRSLLGLPMLSFLDLRFNNISEFLFSNLENLKTLHLSRNRLTRFRVNVTRSKLVTLNLDGNKLTAFTEDLRNLIFNISSGSKLAVNLSDNPWQDPFDAFQRWPGSNLPGLPSPGNCAFNASDFSFTCSIVNRTMTVHMSKFERPAYTSECRRFFDFRSGAMVLLASYAVLFVCLYF